MFHQYCECNDSRFNCQIELHLKKKCSRKTLPCTVTQFNKTSFFFVFVNLSSDGNPKL